MYTAVETVDLVSIGLLFSVYNKKQYVSIYLDSYEYHVSDTKRIT